MARNEIKNRGGVLLYWTEQDGRRTRYHNGDSGMEIGWTSDGETKLHTTGQTIYSQRPDLVIAECRKKHSLPRLWDQ